MKNKVIIIGLILFVIVGIWFYKNRKSIDDVEIRKVDYTFKLEITKLDLEELKSYGLPIILDFGADGCPACDTMMPYLVELNKEMQGKALIKTMDVWKHPELAKGYPVELIPTQFFFYSDGTPYIPEQIEDLELEIIKDDGGKHILTKHVGILTVEQMKQILKEMGIDG